MNSVLADKPLIAETTSLQRTNHEEIIDLSQHWRTLKRAKWGIVTITFLALIVGGFIASSAVPIYKASAKILADPQQPSTDKNEGSISLPLLGLYYQTQYDLIQSRNVAATVVEKLGLVASYKQVQKDRSKEKSSFLSSTIKTIKTEAAALFSKDKPNSNDHSTDMALARMLAASIQANIQVTGGAKSKIIDISYDSKDPQEATDIVNTIAETYIQFGLESRLRKVKDTEGWLGEQFSVLKIKLQDSEYNLSQYRSQQGLVDTSQQERIANIQLQSLTTELIRAQTKLSAAEEQFLAVKNAKKGSKDLYALGSVQQNNTASDMVKEEAFLSRKVNELFERYGEKHPTMIAARSELKSASENLAVEVNKVVDNIEKNYRLSQFQVNNINTLITNSKDSIQTLQDDNFSLASLEREVENNRRIYENFQLSLMEVRGNTQFTASNVQIIDRAIVPVAPFKPNIEAIIFISTLLGVIFAVVLAFIREALDNTFKTPDTIEQKLKLPALGITPIVKVNKHSIAPEQQYLDDPQSIFAESINTIRTGLLFSNIDSPPKSVLVTSATGSEGKSTLAINLAVAYSVLGKTLLLEVDLRKPSIADTLNITTNVGLSDLLIGNIENKQEAVNLLNNNLSVITCGTQACSPLELLSSQKFANLLTQLYKKFDYIVLDGPPTLPVSDSCILANMVDGVIFAVTAENTRIKVAQEAISRLQKHKANIIGAVLTVAAPSKMKNYGDHFYSGEYYGIKPDKNASKAEVAV
jgi:succinoglycan biosynthesis transport protein ExoP